MRFFPGLDSHPPFIRTLLILLGVVLILGAAWFIYENLSRTTYPEVGEINGSTKSLEEYSKYFRNLSNEKGAAYAFEVLRLAKFPQDIDIHRLAHVVGDVLYAKEGIDGIKICTDEFRNACPHSVVVGVLTNEGPSALPKIAEVCTKVPGGRGAYMSCFHGLGHGVLAYNSYDLKKAVEMCQSAGTAAYHDQEYAQCVGGAMMEMVTPTHDPIAHEREYPNYFSDADPLSPCDMSFMPEKAKGACYRYMTPHLFTAAGVDIRNPDSALFPRAMSLCDSLAEIDPAHQKSCYEGFGKEYLGIALGRSVEDAGTASDDVLIRIRSWCAEASIEEGAVACDINALRALYWGGEHTPDASFAFCGLLSSVPQSECYKDLAGQIVYFSRTTAEKNNLCGRLPEPYAASCAAPSAQTSLP